MALRFMLWAFILLALGGCQNPSRIIQGASSHSAAVDTKGAASTEMTALQARQEYLARLAEQRCAQRAR
jgi:hypothetical protein